MVCNLLISNVQVILSIFLHRQDNIRCFDYTGKEIFWIVTNGNVNSLALSDINKDGKNEVKSCKIFIFFLRINFNDFSSLLEHQVV